MNPPWALRANFAIILKRWRLQHHLTQKEMAGKLGFPVSTLSAWETGERFPNGYTLDHIVRYTHISPCRLFCDRSARCMPGRCRLLNG